jgi:heparinase II/III-like protein
MSARGPLAKLRRLRSMNGDEVAFRLRENVRIQLDRMRFHLRAFDKPMSETRMKRSPFYHFKSYLNKEPARRFCLPATPETRDRMRQFVERTFPEWKTAAILEAERLCAHQVEVLGFGEVHLGDEIDWHLDPVTKRRWPKHYWTNYNLVANSGGDPKIVHELNRHQHLPRLAKAYFLTGEARYAQEAVAQISGWIDQNPPGLGIHWHSSLEISLRSISWLWTLFFLLPAPNLDEVVSRRICTSLFEQVEHIWRYLSTYSSPNTHLLAEGTALYLAGVVFSEWPSATNWKDAGESILLLEAERQFTAEGVHRELSSTYHCYALDFYLQALCLAMHNERPWPMSLWRRVEAMVEYVMHLTQPNGAIPRLGDDDGGRALALKQTHYGCFRDALCLGAALYGRPDFKYLAGEFCEEALWLLGEKAWWLYEFQESRPPRNPGALFPEAGYAIQRSGWEPGAHHLVFDFGGMGMCRGGHGHADSLAIVLFSGETELLTDAGTGVYNGAPEWREYFRSSRAHNTALVDREEQSVPGETFSWKRTASARLTRRVSRHSLDYVEGEHFGYAHLPRQIVHRRAILFCRPDCWVITDRFLGVGEHRFDLQYHFPARSKPMIALYDRPVPEAQVAMKSSGDGLHLFVGSSMPGVAQLCEGQRDAIQGWSSRRYGYREPAPAFSFSMPAAAPAAFLSILLPFSSKSMPFGREVRFERLPVANGNAVACRLWRDHQEDLWIAALEDRTIEVLDYQFQGEFFWIRRHSSGECEMFALNARLVLHREARLLSQSEPASDVYLRWIDEEQGLQNEGNERTCAGYAV